jgi:hypothetical protein
MAASQWVRRVTALGSKTSSTTIGRRPFAMSSTCRVQLLEQRLLLSAGDPEPPQAAPPFALSQTFLLNSRPGSNKTIYLDFTGHTTSNTFWNTNYTGGAPITSPVFSVDSDPAFSDLELEVIQNVWLRVVEDFAPFDINVTTQDPGLAAITSSSTSDPTDGMRVVIGGSSLQWYGVQVGGVGGLHSWGGADDAPVFVFPDQLVPKVFLGDIVLIDSVQAAKTLAEASSHEVGHSLGLSHDGFEIDGLPGINESNGDREYYTGHPGAGGTGWASIMGNSYSRPVTQWSRGEYFGASQTQDDLAIITSGLFGITYRPDDHPNAASAADYITQNNPVGGVISFSRSGVIERNFDQDWFKFTTTGGAVSFNFNPAALGANLDILASLYDANGQLVTTSNPEDLLSASLSLNLAAGTYTIMLDGVGVRTPVDGYSDYGSLGQYTITGSYPAVDQVPFATFDPQPAVRTNSIGFVFVRFNENVTGVNITDFRLTRNGVTVSLSGIGVSQNSPSVYSLNLGGVTTPPGDYVFTLRATGSLIVDSSGQAMTQDASISWTNRQITSFVVQSGQTQRSFVNRLEVTIAGSFDLSSLISGNRIRLRRYDLNGTPQSAVDLDSYGSVTRVGNTLIFDFGEQGIGGNRISTAGDGYYELRFDLDESGSFQTTKKFYRLMGDVNGDRVVDGTDGSLVLSRIGAPYDPVYDMDGNGVVDARDRLVVMRSLNRRIGALLVLDG